MTQRREVERVWQRELQLVDHTQQIGVATREIRGVPNLRSSRIVATQKASDSRRATTGWSADSRGMSRTTVAVCRSHLNTSVTSASDSERWRELVM